MICQEYLNHFLDWKRTIWIATFVGCLLDFLALLCKIDKNTKSQDKSIEQVFGPFLATRHDR